VANLDQSPFQILHCAGHKRRANDFWSRGLGTALLVFSLGLCCLQIACSERSEPQSNKTSTEAGAVRKSKDELEFEKLELENTKLKLENAQAAWLTWLPALLGVLIALLSIPTSIWSARLTRANALDQDTHKKRLESYPQLVKAMSPLALYFPVAICFPSTDPDGAASINHNKCGTIGHEMSKWYFEGGGLLMSTEARDAYFRLARALTRASQAPDLRVPSFPRDAEDISREKMDTYVEKLERELKWSLKYVDADKWTFGGPLPKIEGSPPRRDPFRNYLSRQMKRPLKYLPKWMIISGASEAEGANFKHHQFKDFVFLQHLSSELRTRLAEDLASRGRPS
jgi:hypothetical protein